MNTKQQYSTRQKSLTFLRFWVAIALPALIILSVAHNGHAMTAWNYAAAIGAGITFFISLLLAGAGNEAK